MQAVKSGPAVAVVIPVRNRPALLAETLDSLRAQSLRDWEAVVVDDGSAPAELAATRAAAASDERIRCWSRSTLPAGAAACRNLGVEATRAPLVVFLDSDDLLAPGALAGRVAAMHAHPDADFVVRGCEVFERVPGDVVEPWNDASTDEDDDLDRFLACDTPWQTTAPTWRRAALERLGPWSASALSWQDWEFHLRALALGLAYLRDPVRDYFHRRAHAGSLRARHDDLPLLRQRGELLGGVHALLRRTGTTTAARDQLLTGLFLRFALKCARLHRDVDAALEILAGAADAGLLEGTRLEAARAAVLAGVAGQHAGEEDPVNVRRFPELAAVCQSAGRRRAREAPARAPTPGPARPGAGAQQFPA